MENFAERYNIKSDMESTVTQPGRSVIDIDPETSLKLAKLNARLGAGLIAKMYLENCKDLPEKERTTILTSAFQKEIRDNTEYNEERVKQGFEPDLAFEYITNLCRAELESLPSQPQ